MPTNMQSRSQYLVLAQFCQDAITALSDYADRSAEFPRAILEQTVKALESVGRGDTYRFGQKPASALGSYEQLRTLEQVVRIDEALALTTGLLANEGSPDVKKRVADAIHLFTKLQGKALWNFEQPTPVAPPDLAELCRAFKTA